MKKFKNSLFILALVLILCLQAFITIFADAEIDLHAPDFNTPQKQTEIQEMNDIVNKYIEKSIKSNASDSKRLNVPLFQQEETYYCGPASAKMVIHYIDGRSPSQSKLASNMDTNRQDGTIVWKLARELNKYAPYGYTNVSTSSFFSDLIYSIDRGQPVVCHVLANKLPHSRGANTSGHYVVATGYMWGFIGGNAEEYVYYNDPHYDNDYFGRYRCTSSDMEQAIRSRYGYYIRSTDK